jgi:hypothetical protein
VSKPAVVTAQSATGTWKGPTIWSRATSPVTVRSPMVIRKVLSATVGRRSTRSAASRTSMSLVSSGFGSVAMLRTSRVILGGFPNSTDSGRSMGVSPKCASETVRCSSSVAWPSTAYGARSRLHMASNMGSASGAMAST